MHDIAPPHPRYTQLTQMAADVARRTQGMLTLAINPGGKVLYPGRASLDAVRSGRVPLTFVNSASCSPSMRTSAFSTCRAGYGPASSRGSPFHSLDCFWGGKAHALHLQ